MQFDLYNSPDLPDKVSDALKGDLPGIQAHALMMAYKRRTVAQAINSGEKPRLSAVMMLLYRKENLWHTVFMQRPDNQGVHSGQISFPGGKQEESETIIQTAFRETEEEVGIQSHQLRILGGLSEIFIPPSNFIVKPFVAVLEGDFVFNPNPDEVQALLEVPLSDFFREPILTSTEIHIPSLHVLINAPSFIIDQKVLWGATAMMVQEFRMLFGYKL